MPKRRITAKRALQIKQWQKAGAMAARGRHSRHKYPRGTTVAQIKQLKQLTGKKMPRGKLVQAYHHTSIEAAKKIASEGFKPGNMIPSEINKVFFTNKAHDSIIPDLRNGVPKAIRAQVGAPLKDTIPHGAIVGVKVPAVALKPDPQMSNMVRFVAPYERMWAVNAQVLKGRRLTFQRLIRKKPPTPPLPPLQRRVEDLFRELGLN